MRYFATALASILLAVSVRAQVADGDEIYGPPLPPPAPAVPVVYLPEPDFQWENVIEGDTVVHSYKVYNKGGAVLRIEDVKSSCGCASQEFTREIAPGGEGEITLSVRTAGMGGARNKKNARVFTNDPKNRQFLIYIGGEVKSVLACEPAQPLLEGLRGETIETDVVLKRTIDSPVKILGVRGSGTAAFTTELAERVPGEEWNLRIACDTGRVKTGHMFDRLMIEAEVNGVSRFVSLNVRSKLSDTINALPTFVTFREFEITRGLNDPAHMPTRTIAVRSFKNTPFRITGFNVTAQQTGIRAQDSAPMEAPIAVTVDDDAVKSEYTITVALKTILEGTGRPIRCELDILTDDPMKPEIRIPVSIWFPRPASQVSAARPASSAPSGSGTSVFGPLPGTPAPGHVPVPATPPAPPKLAR